MKDIDGFTLARRLSLLAFIALTIWGIAQAASLYAVWGSMQPSFMSDESLKQFLFIALWPMTYAPTWFKFAYPILGLWLILPHLWILEFNR